MDLDPITKEFVDKHKRYCSYITIRWWQATYYIALLVGLVLLLNYRWDVALCLLTFFFAAIYFAAVLFRSYAVIMSFVGHGEREVSEEAIAALKDEDLPIYTIFIPLYKEANIAGKIIHHLNHIDYPQDKLDIKLLLEQDDEATIKAVEECNLPECYDTIIVPDFLPKTKPRACNFGLVRAKGEFSVIFDAEDRPEPDQLKKVVCLFRRLPEKFACVQARLNYYNPRQNLLTRWFTIEYSTTFDVYLPGLEIMNIPVPLGGTSNHFRTHILKELGGWDPFNVTEDCDLGIRIYTKGYRTCMVHSTTWEEANSEVWNWVRQRSRWVKGFFQTHLTHMRNPFRTMYELGPWGFFGFFMSVGASSFMMVINVIYWFIGLCYLLLLGHAAANDQTIWSMVKGPHDFSSYYEGFSFLGTQIKLQAWPLVYPDQTEDPFWSTLSIIFFTISIVLLVSNLIFVFSHCLACIKRKNYYLIPFALLMPFYWVLISVGACKGFFQLFTNPFYWEKTVHGLTDLDPEDTHEPLDHLT